MTIVGITGAAGALGRRTAEYVLASQTPQETVLFSRSPQSLGEFAAAGAQVRQADFDAPATLTEAFGGVDVLLLISTDAVGRRRSQHEAAIAAAVQAGVGRIVYTSMPNADAAFPARLRPLSDDHAATERALAAAGPAWTILRNALYLDLQLGGLAHAGATGQLVSNNGSGRQAPLLRDDCAAAAAAVLLGDGHDNAVYDIGGADLVDDAAIAAALSTRYGRTVEVIGVSDEAYADGLIGAGVPAELAGVLTGFGESIRAGLLETPVGDTEKLIGRPPVSLAEVISRGAGG
ncbi:MAG: NAD(P)H-binding protein [Actinobacteria bacterium]|nr:NAD(P)H-binding protein [Actinomycetota bacterium]